MIKQISFEQKLYVFAAVILSVCSVIPIWSVEYFPSQNASAFLNIMHIFNEMNNPDYAYNEYFMRHLHYMPYIPMYGLLYLFSIFFSLLVAHKILLSLMVIFFPLVIFYSISHAESQNTIFAFPSYLIIFNFGFMRGYYNFFIAIIFLILFMSKWREYKEELNTKRIIVLNLLLLCVYASHLIVTIFLMLIIALMLLLEGKTFKKIIAHFIKISIPVLISIAYFMYLSSSYSIWHQEGSEIKDWWFKTENIYLRFLWPYSHTGKIIAVLPFLILLFILIKKKGDFPIRYVVNKKFSITNSGENRNILLFGIICVLYYLFPWKIMGWHKADVHLIIFMFVFFLPCSRAFKYKKSRISFVVLNVVLSISFFYQVGAQVKSLSNEIKDEYLAGMQYMDKNSTMLPISAGGNRYGVVNPYAHLFDYYGLHKGIITGKSLAAYNTISPVWYRDYKEFPNFKRLPTFSVTELNNENLKIIKNIYDYVLIWGNNPDVENMFLNNGFISVFEKQRLHIFEPA